MRRNPRNCSRGPLRRFSRFFRRSTYLVEEQPIRFGELGAETIVEAVDKARKRYLLVLGAGRADIGRPLQRLGLALRQANRALVHLLNPVEPKRHLMVQNECLAIARRRKFRRKIPSEGVEPLEIDVPIGDDLRQEGVKVSIGRQLTAKFLSLILLRILKLRNPMALDQESNFT